MFAVKVKIVDSNGKLIGEAVMDKEYKTKPNAAKLASKVESTGLMTEIVEK